MWIQLENIFERSGSQFRILDALSYVDDARIALRAFNFGTTFKDGQFVSEDKQDHSVVEGDVVNNGPFTLEGEVIINEPSALVEGDIIYNVSPLLSRESLTRNLINQAMDNICQCLKFTTEVHADFKSG